MGAPKTLNPVIHAAVRRDLARLHDALGRANDGEVARASQLELAYANLHRQLQHHHQSEDRFIYPFVARIEPSPELMRAMDEEHHAMADALAETRAAMGVYASTASAADAKKAQDSVAQTTAVVERHLVHEESDFEPLVWPHVETSEWKAVEKQTRPTSLAEAGTFFAWIQDGMTDENRTFLRSAVPPPVTFLLSRLGGRSYHRDVASAWKDSPADSTQPRERKRLSPPGGLLARRQLAAVRRPLSVRCHRDARGSRRRCRSLRAGTGGSAGIGLGRLPIGQRVAFAGRVITPALGASRSASRDARSQGRAPVAAMTRATESGAHPVTMDLGDAVAEVVREVPQHHEGLLASRALVAWTSPGVVHQYLPADTCMA